MALGKIEVHHLFKNKSSIKISLKRWGSKYFEDFIYRIKSRQKKCWSGGVKSLKFCIKEIIEIKIGCLTLVVKLGINYLQIIIIIGMKESIKY